MVAGCLVPAAEVSVLGLANGVMINMLQLVPRLSSLPANGLGFRLPCGLPIRSWSAQRGHLLFDCHLL